MADRSVPIFMDCSSCWNCASWVRNWVPSAGFMGSWFWSWATRSCRNMSLVTSVELVAVVVLDEPELAAMESLGEIAEIMGSPLRIHGIAADFGGDHLVYRLLRVTVVVKPGNEPGVDQPAVGHLDHLIRLGLCEGAAWGNGIHRHHLAAQHLRHSGGGLRGREVVLVIAVAAVGPASAGVGDPRIGAEERLRGGRGCLTVLGGSGASSIPVLRGVVRSAWFATRSTPQRSDRQSEQISLKHAGWALFPL